MAKGTDNCAATATGVTSPEIANPVKNSENSSHPTVDAIAMINGILPWCQRRKGSNNNPTIMKRALVKISGGTESNATFMTIGANPQRNAITIKKIGEEAAWKAILQ